MRPSFRLLFLIPALAPVQVFAKEAVKEFTLYHRAFHPTAPLIQYSKRGQLILDPINQPSFRSSPTFAKDLLSFGQTLRDSGVNLDAAFYQIALERENDVSEAHWDISVVKIVGRHPFQSPHHIYFYFITSVPSTRRIRRDYYSPYQRSARYSTICSRLLRLARAPRRRMSETEDSQI